MTDEQIEKELDVIRAENDPGRRNLLVAQLVTTLFREIGCEPVLVGGSAVEFYTDGRYVSGDVDVCYAGAHLPTPRERGDIMSRIGRPLGARKWEVAGVLVDVMGWVQTSAKTPFQRMASIEIIQIEDLIPERLLIATVPHRDKERLAVAKMLVKMVMEGAIEADLHELERVAESPDYRVKEELQALIAELSRENLESRSP